MDSPTLVCSKCEKEVGAFCKGRRCHDCVNAYHQDWYRRNADQERAKARTRASAGSEGRRAYMHGWRAANQDRIVAYRKAHRERRPDYREQQRNAQLIRKYGITSKDYDDLLERQNGCCAICRRKVPLVVDHDHQTDEVRGLLCNSCNRAIGTLQEDPKVLRAAADYLEVARDVTLVENLEMAA